MRRTRRPRIRTLPGGTDRRRRHRFPALVPSTSLRRPLSSEYPPHAESYLPSGDIDALLWEYAGDLASAASER
jgi:hypothetical protein